MRKEEISMSTDESSNFEKHFINKKCTFNEEAIESKNGVSKRVIGLVKTGTNTSEVHVQITQSQLTGKLTGQWVSIDWNGDEALLYLESAFLDGKEYIIEELEPKLQRYRDRIIAKCRVFSTISGRDWVVVPGTATPVFLEEDISRFYHQPSIKTPIKFLRAIKFPLTPNFDLFSIHQNGCVLGRTRCGKGYLVNIMLSQAQSVPFPETNRPLGILYIDTPGQWDQEGGAYGFFGTHFQNLIATNLKI